MPAASSAPMNQVLMVYQAVMIGLAGLSFDAGELVNVNAPMFD